MYMYMIYICTCTMYTCTSACVMHVSYHVQTMYNEQACRDECIIMLHIAGMIRRSTSVHSVIGHDRVCKHYAVLVISLLMGQERKYPGRRGEREGGGGLNDSDGSRYICYGMVG